MAQPRRQLPSSSSQPHTSLQAARPRQRHASSSSRPRSSLQGGAAARHPLKAPPSAGQPGGSRRSWSPTPANQHPAPAPADDPTPAPAQGDHLFPAESSAAESTSTQPAAGPGVATQGTTKSRSPPPLKDMVEHVRHVISKTVRNISKLDPDNVNVLHHTLQKYFHIVEQYMNGSPVDGSPPSSGARLSSAIPAHAQPLVSWPRGGMLDASALIQVTQDSLRGAEQDHSTPPSSPRPVSPVGDGRRRTPEASPRRGRAPSSPEPVGRPRKRRRREAEKEETAPGSPSSSTDTPRSEQDNDTTDVPSPPEICGPSGEKLQLAPAVQSVAEMVRAGYSGDPGDGPVLMDDEVEKVSRHVVYQLLGPDGRKLVAELLRDGVGRSQRSQGARAVMAADRAADELHKLGQQELATIAAKFVRVTRDAGGFRSTGLGRLSSLHDRLTLVQEWESLIGRCSDVQGDAARAMSGFLETQGFPSRQGHTVRHRIGAFVAAKLGFSKPRDLTDRIYRWRPIALLAEVFGMGVLAVMPANIHTIARKMNIEGAGGRPDSHGTRSDKFGAIIRATSEQLPVLRQLCDAALESIVRPCLDGADLGQTKATRLASRGDVGLIDDLAIWDMVQPETPGSSRVEPADEGSP